MVGVYSRYFHLYEVPYCKQGRRETISLSIASTGQESFLFSSLREIRLGKDQGTASDRNGTDPGY